MSTLHRHRRNGGTAIFAAAMLFFQLALGGFALGTAAAAPPMLDIFGNPLCITSHHGSPNDDGREHSGLPECCTPGCSMFAPLNEPDRERYALANPLALSTAQLFTAHIPIATASDDHDPGSPRAPPLKF